MGAVKVVGGLVALLGVAGIGVWVGSGIALDARLGQRFETHEVTIPVPFPLREPEIEALRAERRAALGVDEGVTDTDTPVDPLEDVDLDALARQRALERGRHLLEARYPCGVCHGEDFAGGVMVDDPMFATWLGPNITRGGLTASYTMADWDRIVRHGVKHDGRPAIMPSVDFLGMSDQELSDIVLVITSAPPSDAVVPAPRFGPVARLLLASGAVPLIAESLDHTAVHPIAPPPIGETVEFGAHLAQVCTGCHRRDLEGGPVPGGDPSWPPASNLTPVEEGLKGWTWEQFQAAMVQGVRPDGSALRAPMSDVLPAARHMREVELRALWAYLQSVPPRPTGR